MGFEAEFAILKVQELLLTIGLRQSCAVVTYNFVTHVERNKTRVGAKTGIEVTKAHCGAVFTM